MKRFLSLILILTVLLCVCGCSRTNLSSGAKVELTFIYGDQSIETLLPEAEAQEVIRILDGRAYDPVSWGIPSCGFDEDVSLKVGGRVFAIACDTCNCVQDMGSFRYFDIPQEDMDYIHTLFEKYGGFFPCV